MPVFGHKNLEDIRTLHIVTFINDLSKPEARKDGKSGSFHPALFRLFIVYLKISSTGRRSGNLLKPIRLSRLEEA
ncbi:hypothetical protein P7H15_25480 [Paenibacillus larvae]|nr:hypothetical protein [Paenibacillus larvae]MDT2295486.1 hypothetical protein [Paenibacillus larvae]